MIISAIAVHPVDKKFYIAAILDPIFFEFSRIYLSSKPPIPRHRGVANFSGVPLKGPGGAV